MVRYIMIILAVSYMGMAGAQIPQAFRYQAVAHRADGSVMAEKTIAVKLEILRNLGGAESIPYQEIQHVTTNDFGIFSLNIGEGETTQDLSQIDWSSGVYSLRVSVDENNGSAFTLMGTSALLAVPYALYAKNAGNGSVWTQSGNNIYFSGGNVGIGSTNPAGKLEVTAATDGQPGEALFEVKNKSGETVFAVYEDSVRVVVPNDLKGGRGGFAVGGRKKGVKGDWEEIMLVTPDSIRMYIDDAINGKGGKGGFAVGGRTSAKGDRKSYFDISGRASAEIINPSEPRIIWYPRKEAFLTGRVLIEHPDSVGTNSFSAGFESKAVGNFSQAMGFRSVARGINSTAFGDSSLANGASSFAAGVNARAMVPGTFALGKDIVAKGTGSFAIGFNSATTGNNSIAMGVNNLSSQLFSVAIGNDTRSTGIGAIALGNSALSSGLNSIALGYSSEARGNLSSSLGNDARANGVNSTALGYKSIADAPYASVLGSDAESRGENAIALGYRSKALGAYSSVLGSQSESRGKYSIALGASSRADADYSTSLGNNARADSVGALALGNGSRAIHNNSIAIGTEANSSGVGSIAIGKKSMATGNSSTAMGSEGVEASGDFSMAFGWNANTNSQPGSIVFGDHSLSANTVVATAPNQFVARAGGGYTFYTNAAMSTKIYAAPGTADWNITSDRNLKENFRDLDREMVLSNLKKINIQSWNYKSQDPSVRHAGITAQDFHQYFGFGNSDTTVTHTDLNGVSMVAIQGLIDRTDNLLEEVKSLQLQNEALRKEIENLKSMLK